MTSEIEKAIAKVRAAPPGQATADVYQRELIPALKKAGPGTYYTSEGTFRVTEKGEVVVVGSIGTTAQKPVVKASPSEPLYRGPDVLRAAEELREKVPNSDITLEGGILTASRRPISDQPPRLIMITPLEEKNPQGKSYEEIYEEKIEQTSVFLETPFGSQRLSPEAEQAVISLMQGIPKGAKDVRYVLRPEGEQLVLTAYFKQEVPTEQKPVEKFTFQVPPPPPDFLTGHRTLTYEEMQYLEQIKQSPDLLTGLAISYEQAVQPIIEGLGIQEPSQEELEERKKWELEQEEKWKKIWSVTTEDWKKMSDEEKRKWKQLYFEVMESSPPVSPFEEYLKGIIRGTIKLPATFLRLIPSTVEFAKQPKESLEAMKAKMEENPGGVFGEMIGTMVGTELAFKGASYIKEKLVKPEPPKIQYHVTQTYGGREQQTFFEVEGGKVVGDVQRTALKQEWVVENLPEELKEGYVMRVVKTAKEAVKGKAEVGMAGTKVQLIDIKTGNVVAEKWIYGEKWAEGALFKPSDIVPGASKMKIKVSEFATQKWKPPESNILVEASSGAKEMKPFSPSSEVKPVSASAAARAELFAEGKPSAWQNLLDYLKTQNKVIQSKAAGLSYQITTSMESSTNPIISSIWKFIKPFVKKGVETGAVTSSITYQPSPEIEELVRMEAREYTIERRLEKGEIMLKPEKREVVLPEAGPPHPFKSPELKIEFPPHPFGEVKPMPKPHIELAAEPAEFSRVGMLKKEAHKRVKTVEELKAGRVVKPTKSRMEEYLENMPREMKKFVPGMKVELEEKKQKKKKKEEVLVQEITEPRIVKQPLQEQLVTQKTVQIQTPALKQAFETGIKQKVIPATTEIMETAKIPVLKKMTEQKPPSFKLNFPRYEKTLTGRQFFAKLKPKYKEYFHPIGIPKIVKGMVKEWEFPKKKRR